MMDEIQVGIAMSCNSEDYFELLARSAALTADRPELLHYFLGINHGADASRVEEIVRTNGIKATILDAHVDSGYSSFNHGACLDLIFEAMTSRVCMLVDCDVAFLAKGWDSMMRDVLRDDVVIVGSEYDGEKYRNFPNVIGAMFDGDVIRSLGVSFKPEGGRIEISGDDLIVYGYDPSVGSVPIILDTGSELPRRVKAAGLRGQHMPLLRAGMPGAKFMIEPMRGEEYQLHGEPLFTHIGRSFTRALKSDPDAMAWETAIWRWLNGTHAQAR